MRRALVVFGVVAAIAAAYVVLHGRASTGRRASPASAASGASPTSGAVPTAARPSRRDRPPPPAWLAGAPARPRAPRPADLDPGSTAAAADRRYQEAELVDSPEAWDDAAEAYALAASDLTGAAAAEALYAELLARRNAVQLSAVPIPAGDDPVAFPPRVEALVEALDQYVAAAPDSPDAAGIRFLAASAHWRHRHFDDATIARLEAIVFAPDVTEVTEYSINLLLDTLARAGRPADLRRVIDRLLADPARIDRFPEIRPRLVELLAGMPS